MSAPTPDTVAFVLALCDRAEREAAALRLTLAEIIATGFAGEGLLRSADASALKWVRAAVIEAARPKGPMVQVRRTNLGRDAGTIDLEFVRRTATQVVLRRSDGHEYRFKLDGDAREINTHGSRSDRSRLVDPDAVKAIDWKPTSAAKEAGR